MSSIGRGLETVPADCAKHGPYEAQTFTWPSGRRVVGQCPQCREEERAEEVRRELAEKRQAKERRIARLIGRSGLPERYLSRTFDNYRAETEGQQRVLGIAKAYAERFEDRLKHGGGLVFCGKPGTGKTHLAAAICNHVMRELGRSALFLTVLRAVRSVKETWRQGAERTEQDALDALLEPDLLVLDEVGVQFGTESERLILFEIINGRYEDMRPTILLSNLPVEELEQYIGVRALDRMREGGGAVLAFDWDSYRTRVHKDDQLPGQQVEPVSWMQVPSERDL